jgi:putative sporulation protein YtaF
LYILFISLANNMDNIGVRIAYSIRGIRINTLKNLWISVITFIISSLSALLGTEISGIFSKQLSSVISMLLLVAIGIWIILEQYIKRDDKQDEADQKQNKGNIFNILRKPENADVDRSKTIDFKEATVLGIAMSINNIGGGVSAGMIGLNELLVGLMSALISFLALWTGNYITEFLKRFNLGNKAAILAGVALIAIGIKQVI